MNEAAKNAPQSNVSREATAASEDAGPTKGDEGGVVTKVKWVANSAPSLALDPLREDGVHRRPYESKRDASPDKSDSDTASTYEDASAETPEQDDGPLELPHDSASKDDVDSQEPQTGDNCIVS